MTNRFTLTKKIAKHGNQAIIIIPKILQNQLKPNTIIEMKIKILDENLNEKMIQEGGEKWVKI
ncbi:hypothetical protein J4465_01210 [Candidatus Pacearchaeota archaeon]|nr:hypothetical protein [Candidatus Pacearchaeota archaeon]